MVFFLVVASEWGHYLDECPMANYTCPSICDVDHIHHKEDRDCSFMEKLIRKKKVKGKKETKTYIHLDKKVEVEWVSSYYAEER